MASSMLNAELQRVTRVVTERSRDTRARYLQRVQHAADSAPPRSALGCANLAHTFAASDAIDKLRLRQGVAPNLAIVTAYNDMLSAHQPYEDYPRRLKAAARRHGATAQVAGGSSGHV